MPLPGSLPVSQPHVDVKPLAPTFSIAEIGTGSEEGQGTDTRVASRATAAGGSGGGAASALFGYVNLETAMAMFKSDMARGRVGPPVSGGAGAAVSGARAPVRA